MAAQRDAPLSAEADWKTKRKVKAKTPKMVEKFDGPVDGEGGKGDLPGHLSTGEDRQIQALYRDWVHSNNGAQLSGRIYNNILC